MSSYTGANGLLYGNPFFQEVYSNPPLNVLNMTTSSPIVIKCEPEGVHTAPPLNLEPPASEKLKIKEDMSEEPVSEDPELDIIVNNVVCSFNVRCHLNLRQIALNGANVEYRRENGMVTMKIRKPYTTASIWSSGKITCTGATSNEDAKAASRKVARKLQQLGFRVRFTNYRVVNVLCTCFMYFGINLIKFAEKHRKLASYEPELHPGCTYKVKELKATLKLFTTGSITITAPSIRNVQLAVEHVFPLVYEFKTAPPVRKLKPGMSEAIKVKREKEDLNDSDEENVDHLPSSDDQDSD